MPYADSDYERSWKMQTKGVTLYPATLERLYAAAPELLNACKLIAACLGDWIEVADRDADTSEDERRLAIAYAAIAKAEGRSE